MEVFFRARPSLRWASLYRNSTVNVHATGLDVIGQFVEVNIFHSRTVHISRLKIRFLFLNSKFIPYNYKMFWNSSLRIVPNVMVESAELYLAAQWVRYLWIEQCGPFCTKSLNHRRDRSCLRYWFHLWAISRTLALELLFTSGESAIYCNQF